jgi:hypothetical protein
MRNRPWYIRFWQSRIIKIVPEWVQKKGAQRMMWLLILACIYWQLSVRLSGQQFYFALLYMEAQIELFFGFDPLGEISVKMPERNVDVTRLGIADHVYFTSSWSKFWDAAWHGISRALFFIGAIIIWFLVRDFLEEQEREQRQFAEEIERRTANIKEQKIYQWETSKPAPTPPIETLETYVTNEFETPPVELLTELIGEPEDEDLTPAPPPEEPSLAKPLRLPGRIYRDDD